MNDREEGQGKRVSWRRCGGILAMLLAGGCYTYVPPQVRVAPERVHEIQPLDLTRAEQPAATTEPSTQPTTRAMAKVEISLAEVRQMALHNNLDLSVQLLSPTISRTVLSEEEARFESVFTANIDYSTTDAPTASQLNSSSSKDLRITPGLQIPLITGGTIDVSVPADRFETNSQFSTLNPSYSSDVSASISQPLLRGAGLATNTARIVIAGYDYRISQAETKLEVIRVLAAAERAYWRLYAAQKDLEVRRKEYDLADAQLARARRQVAAGAAAEVEIIRAESGVADTLETIITAENALRDRERELKRIINQPGLEMGSPVLLTPATLPRPVPYKLDSGELIKVALDERMEMLEQELRIAQDTVDVSVARNGTLPLVTLDYTYNVNGLGPSWDQSFNMVADKDFEDHRIGVRMEVPIGNGAARARLRRALASRLQSLNTRDQRRLTIQQEVFNAIDQLDANWQRILAAQKRVILAARVLDAEVRQFEQQLRTSTDVLDAQTNLANAQSAEIAAVTEYQIAQVDLAFATGMLLGASGVSWQATSAPSH
jgi:outer membrane protein TolC